MMDAATMLAPRVGVGVACEAFGVPRPTFYRCKRGASAERKSKPRPRSHRALPPEQRQHALDLLHSDRFVDVAPAEVYATLLDEGARICSIRTMYRILCENDEVRERRDQLRHPAYARPELLATAPNQVWSWDITKLRAAQKWSYFYLYVLLDIYSRYVVGWMLAHRESGELAAQLVTETYAKQDIDEGQLTVHADRGSAPKSKALKQTFVDLGVAVSHSRPRISNDNPYSEAQFKTLKYRPTYPDRFGSFEDAKAFCRDFFSWYNELHRHSGIAMMTPSDVHHGRAPIVLAERQRVIDAAYAAHPERFVNGPPTVELLPPAVWINPPTDRTQTELITL